MIAAAQRKAKAVGVELDAALILQSRKTAEAKKVSHLTEFRPKLLSLLKPGSRIISYTFPMDGWEPDHTEVVGARPIYLWVVPTEADDEPL